MKIRNGFVSNSSSSSFCIIGFSIDDSNLAKLLNVEYNEEDGNWEDIESAFESKAKENKIQGISLYHDYESNYCYIGKDITKMKDNETMGDFKTKAEEDIQKVLPKNKKKCSILLETIYG